MLFKAAGQTSDPEQLMENDSLAVAPRIGKSYWAVQQNKHFCLPSYSCVRLRYLHPGPDTPCGTHRDNPTK